MEQKYNINAQKNGQSMVVTFRLHPDMIGQLEVLAKKSKISVSELIRLYISKGIQSDSYKDSIDKIAEVTEVSLEKVIAPYMNRIISLIQKNGKIEAATYFLNLHELMCDENTNNTTLEVIDDCNKLAVGYIKQANSDVEKYLSSVPEIAERALKLGKGIFYDD